MLEDQFEDVTITQPEATIRDLIDRLRVRYIRNQGRQALTNLAHQAVEDPLSVAKEMQSEARRLIELTSRRGEVYGTGDYNRAIAEYDKQVIAGAGPTFGFKELDDHFYGQVGLTFVVAPPKTYKSWFAINCQVENVLAGNFPYLYSLELPAIESDWRLRCMAADIPYWKYLKKRLTEEEREKFRTISDAMDGLGAYRIDKPKPGERTVERLVQKAQDQGADLIIVDQLQYVENEYGRALGALNKTEEYFGVINDFRNHSDQIPIMIVHQFNREAVLGATEMPPVQRAKGSSAIEEAATLALGMWASKDMRQSNVVELGNLASRNYEYVSWNVGVQLSRGCQLKMLGEVTDED